MAYPTYSSYRDSGVAWLGEVPSHWGVIPIKQIIKEHSGNGFPIELQGNNGDIPFLKVGDLNKQGKLLQSYSNLVTNELVKEKKWNIVPKFSLIAPKIGEALKKNHRKIVLDDVIIDNNCIAFECLKVDLNYHYYLSLIIDFNWFENGGTVPSISVQKYKKQKVCLPPLAEQTAIADYLDTQTAQIDALIDKQQNLLAKLAEQRSSVITQAVTRGLNPNAPMKESGVAWLGEVPSHWEIWKITHAINLIGSGTTPKSDNAEYYDGEILWVTTSELRESLISDTKQKISDSAIKDYSALKKYPKNSVAIAMYGATIGRLGILEKEATFNQACCVFGNSDILHYKFLFYWLWQRRPALISLSNGGGQPNLSQDDLKKIKIPLPPLAEQTAIADYLDEQTAHIDCLSQKVEQAIGRLKEYRTALITQAVTGKIKVITEG